MMISEGYFQLLPIQYQVLNEEIYKLEHDVGSHHEPDRSSLEQRLLELERRYDETLRDEESFAGDETEMAARRSFHDNSTKAIAKLKNSLGIHTIPDDQNADTIKETEENNQ